MLERDDERTAQWWRIRRRVESLITESGRSVPDGWDVFVSEFVVVCVHVEVVGGFMTDRGCRFPL